MTGHAPPRPFPGHQVELDDEDGTGYWRVSCECGWRGRDGGWYATWPAAKTAHTRHRNDVELAAAAL